MDAIDFGLEIGTFGYSLFLAGAPGSGREGTVLDCLEVAASQRPAPSDVVYVHNFEQPDRPRVLRLPAGRGRALRADLDELLRCAREEIPRALGGEGFERRRQEALSEVERRCEDLGEEMRRAASFRGRSIQRGFWPSRAICPRPMHSAGPLALHATITFEQSYGGIDGDSASSTELYALLSALAELPIRQDIAVTGARRPARASTGCGRRDRQGGRLLRGLPRARPH